MRNILGVVAVAVLVACGGAVESDPVAFCPGERLESSTATAAENIGLEFVIDCTAPEAVAVVWDGPAWDAGRCEAGPAMVCVPSCTVAGGCEMSARIEAALVDAGF